MKIEEELNWIYILLCFLLVEGIIVNIGLLIKDKIKNDKKLVLILMIISVILYSILFALDGKVIKKTYINSRAIVIEEKENKKLI